jgi:hypothetical protein
MVSILFHEKRHPFTNTKQTSIPKYFPCQVQNQHSKRKIIPLFSEKNEPAGGLHIILKSRRKGHKNLSQHKTAEINTCGWKIYLKKKET